MTRLHRSAPSAQTKNLDIINRKSLSVAATMGDAAMRLLAFGAGVAIVAALASSIVESGGLSGAHALLVYALAAGVVAGAFVVTRATRWQTLIVVGAVLSGEAYSVLATGERIITQRVDAQSKVSAANAAGPRAKARLEKAELARDRFSGEARLVVATKSCRVECRTLLEKQLTSLDTEVIAARAAVASTAPAKSESPMADLLGVEGSTLDLLSAALLSFGANVLGATLVGWAARPNGRSSDRGIVIQSEINARQDLDHYMQHDVTDIAEAHDPRVIQVIRDLDQYTQHEPDHDSGKPQISPRTAKIIRLIRSEGGIVEGPQRATAERLGVPQSSLHRALQEAVEAGLADTDATGKVRLRLLG